MYNCCAQLAILNQIMLKSNSALQFELPSKIIHFQLIPIRGSIFSTNGTKFHKIQILLICRNHKFHENFGGMLIRMQFPEF